MDVKAGSDPKQRAHARYDIRMPVRFSHAGQQEVAECRNLSIGGMFLESDIAIPYGAATEIQFRIPTHANEIRVKASVCWIERSNGVQVGFGVKFGALRAVEVWALNQLFAQQG
jgi:hypothetical protein